jgi:hypothetical protein
MEFTEKTREGIDDYPLEEEKKEHLRRALDIHMQRNPDAHMEVVKDKKEDISVPTQNTVDTVEVSSDKQDSYHLSVRACPCCLNFLKAKFNMSDGDAKKFLGMDSGTSYGSKSEYSGSSGEYNGSGNSGYSSSNNSSYNK